MSLLDEHKESLPEGVYLEMCDNLKKLFLTGEDLARDSYLLDLTNEYYKLLEDNEALRHEVVEQKRDLLRANVTRFERVSRPATIQPRGIIESLLFDPRSPPLSGISSSNSNSTNTQPDSMDHDSREVIPSVSSVFTRVNPARIGRR
tara:strand:- start:180 stop:620 length:441 start_codon:yes stop_codon:yes gene_type:complete